MEFFELAELFKKYEPPAIYTITEIKSKNGTHNDLHDEVIGCPAYPLYLSESERGYICVIPNYDNRYHRIHTSAVISASPWGHGESVVTIETMNTIYVLTKREEGHGQ